MDDYEIRNSWDLGIQKFYSGRECPETPCSDGFTRYKYSDETRERGGIREFPQGTYLKFHNEKGKDWRVF